MMRSIYRRVKSTDVVVCYLAEGPTLPTCTQTRNRKLPSGVPFSRDRHPHRHRIPRSLISAPTTHQLLPSGPGRMHANSLT